MRNEIVVSKMQGYVDKILRYSHDMDYDAFISNEVLVEACVFNLSQLGELANKVDTRFRATHPDVPWGEIYGLRNRIVHDYEGVNFRLIWEIIQEDLPELKKKLEKL